MYSKILTPEQRKELMKMQKPSRGILCCKKEVVKLVPRDEVMRKDTLVNFIHETKYIAFLKMYKDSQIDDVVQSKQCERSLREDYYSITFIAF